MMKPLLTLSCLLGIVYISGSVNGVQFTKDEKAERACLSYKMICPLGKVCVLQHIELPRKMSFPVCVSAWRNIVSTNACDQPPSPGRCRARFRRWYFNKHSGRCTWFHYGGCGGNENNFRTRNDCLKMCFPSVNASGVPTDNIAPRDRPQETDQGNREVAALMAAPTATIIIPQEEKPQLSFLDDVKIKVKRRRRNRNRRKKGRKHRRRGKKGKHGRRSIKRRLRGRKPDFQEMKSRVAVIPRRDLIQNDARLQKLIKATDNESRRQWSRLGPHYRNFRLFSILSRRQRHRKLHSS